MILKEVIAVSWDDSKRMDKVIAKACEKEADFRPDLVRTLDNGIYGYPVYVAYSWECVDEDSPGLKKVLKTIEDIRHSRIEVTEDEGIGNILVEDKCEDAHGVDEMFAELLNWEVGISDVYFGEAL